METKVLGRLVRDQEFPQKRGLSKGQTLPDRLVRLEQGQPRAPNDTRLCLRRWPQVTSSIRAGFSFTDDLGTDINKCFVYGVTCGTCLEHEL